MTMLILLNSSNLNLELHNNVYVIFITSFQTKKLKCANICSVSNFIIWKIVLEPERLT